MKLILIRHGETEWNKQRRIQGCRSDTRLSPKGLEQADRLAAVLRKERIDAIYASPMKRASETAQIIAEACKLQVHVFNELREIDAGELDGLFERELAGPYETAWKEFRNGNASTPLPGGVSARPSEKDVMGCRPHAGEAHRWDGGSCRPPSGQSGHCLPSAGHKPESDSTLEASPGFHHHPGVDHTGKQPASIQRYLPSDSMTGCSAVSH